MTQGQKLQKIDTDGVDELYDTLKSFWYFMGVFVLMLAGIIAYVTAVGAVEKLLSERMTTAYAFAPAPELRRLKIYAEAEGYDENGRLTGVPVLLGNDPAVKSYYALPLLTFDCEGGYIVVARAEDNRSLKYDTLNRVTVKKNAVDENGKSIIELHGFEAKHAKTGIGKAAGDSPLAVQLDAGADYYYNWLDDQIYFWDFPFVSPEYRSQSELTFDYITDHAPDVPQAVVNAHRLKLVTRLLVTVFAAANSKEIIAEATVLLTSYGGWQDDMTDNELLSHGVDLTNVPYGTYLVVEHYWEAIGDDAEEKSAGTEPVKTER